jgi:hypothetical protein
MLYCSDNVLALCVSGALHLLVPWHGVQTKASLVPNSISSNVDIFLSLLDQLQPSAPGAAAGAAAAQKAPLPPGVTTGDTDSGSFDLGSLIAAAAAAAPLIIRAGQHSDLQSKQQQQHVAGGVLTPAAAAAGSCPHSTNLSGTSSNSSSLLRVVLIYGRSYLPAPVLRSNRCCSDEPMMCSAAASVSDTDDVVGA